MRGQQQGALIRFAAPEALFTRLTHQRGKILLKMTRAGAMSIRELAPRVERDVRQVHDDVLMQLNVGVVEGRKTGVSLFPTTSTTSISY